MLLREFRKLLRKADKIRHQNHEVVENMCCSASAETAMGAAVFLQSPGHLTRLYGVF